MQSTTDEIQESERPNQRRVSWLDVGCAWLMVLIVATVALLA